MSGYHKPLELEDYRRLDATGVVEVALEHLDHAEHSSPLLELRYNTGYGGLTMAEGRLQKRERMAAVGRLVLAEDLRNPHPGPLATLACCGTSTEYGVAMY